MRAAPSTAAPTPDPGEPPSTAPSVVATDAGEPISPAATATCRDASRIDSQAVNWFRLAQPVILAWGWRRAAIAFVAGAVSALAMAPVHFWPVLFVTFPLLVWLIDGAAAARWRGAAAGFLIGWWFGFGYFLAGLYWVGYAFLVDAKTFGWLLAVRGHRASGRTRRIYRARRCACPRAVDAGGASRPHACRRVDDERMAARPCADRISVERIRLRAHGAARARAERGGVRHLGAHFHRGRGVREPGAARRRQEAAPLRAAHRRRRSPRGARAVRHDPARARSDRDGGRRAPAHHAARRAAGPEIQLPEQKRGDAALPRSVAGSGIRRRRSTASPI